MEASTQSYEKYDELSGKYLSTTRYGRKSYVTGDEKELVATIKKNAGDTKNPDNLVVCDFYSAGIPEGVAVVVNSTGSTTETAI